MPFRCRAMPVPIPPKPAPTTTTSCSGETRSSTWGERSDGELTGWECRMLVLTGDLALLDPVEEGTVGAEQLALPLLQGRCGVDVVGMESAPHVGLDLRHESAQERATEDLPGLARDGDRTPSSRVGEDGHHDRRRHARNRDVVHDPHHADPNPFRSADGPVDVERHRLVLEFLEGVPVEQVLDLGIAWDVLDLVDHQYSMADGGGV